MKCGKKLESRKPVFRVAAAVFAVAGLVLASGAAGAPQSGRSSLRVESPETPRAVTNLYEAVVEIIQTEADGKTIRLELRGGQVVKAEIDGKEVPADRIVREGDVIRIKDEAGGVVFEHKAAESSDAATHRWAVMNAIPSLTWNRYAEPNQGMAFALAEEPKVMIGVTMAEPDGSLRGHLGIEEGAATMITAVYEGLPASVAGLEPYDVIVAVGGKAPAGPDAVRKALAELEAGGEVRMTVVHQGARKDVTLKVEAFDRERFKAAKVKAISAADDESANPFAAAAAGERAAAAGAYAEQLKLLQGLGALHGDPLVGRLGDDDVQVFTIPDGQDMARKILIERQLRSGQGAAGLDEDMARVHSEMEQMREQVRKEMEQLRGMIKQLMEQRQDNNEPAEKNKS